MASLDPSYLMVKIFVGSFSIAIIALALAVCEAKHVKTLSQTSQNPKSNNDHSINTHILDSKNGNAFFLSSYNLSIQGSIKAVSISSENFNENGPLSREVRNLDKNLQSATASCRELISLASYNLNISSLASAPTPQTLVNLKTNLCGAMAYIETCLDAFEYAPENVRNMVTASLDSSRKNVSNNLSILSTVNPAADSLINGGRNAWPPSWMSTKERKLLVDSINTTAIDVVVAKDGSGKFKTISEAIKSAPQNSEKRFVIYVKQGKYNESVKIDESRWNIMMFGDGMNKTIVSGRLSNATGSTTVESATFGVYGRGFIARDMGFENTAGPHGGQAVALLSSSDKSTFYKCNITGYQDTLFAISNRQFYRECHISGTIDFIFGHSSSAVFQSCTILVRKPLQGQVNTITAQGKSDPRCPSGFSIHKSDIVATEDLAGARTFLGRPWREYATTVFIENNLDGLIDPAGWSGWKPDDALPDTVYYGEYGNKGKGSTTTNRVSGKGVRGNISVAEAQKFKVKEFIGGDEWLPATDVPFQPALSLI